jgi:4-amino-4-deoxy-L-arabinose transferase-like glycosyltransferase
MFAGKWMRDDLLNYHSTMAQQSQHIESVSADNPVVLPTGSSVALQVDNVSEGEVAQSAAPKVIDRLWFIIPSALFLFSAATLLFKLDQHPSSNYNWESYTTWRFFPWWDHPTTSIFNINEGLMTNAGTSPLLAPLIWASMKVFGVGLFALRLPGALISALAIPLTWLVGRRLVSQRGGLLAAVLLALLPAFLLYGRTATNVGISLVPALFTIYFITRALKEPRNWIWLSLLQLALIVSVYAYSPIRILWPISVALFAVEIAFHRGERWRLAIACLVTIVALPAFLVLYDGTPDHSPKVALKSYYNARGETAISWKGNPETYKYYLKMTPEEKAAGHLIGSGRSFLWRLVKQNARNLENLYLDRETSYAIIDFWNPHGRLYFSFLVPFFLVGLAKSLWGVFRRAEDRVLQACFWGWSLPLLFTSNVHIGRLIYVLPILCIFVALGFFTIVDFLVPHLRLMKVRHLPAIATTVAALILVVATADASLADYRVPPPVVPAVETIARLGADANQLKTSGGNAVIVRPVAGMELESIEASTFRLVLDDEYQFVDISPGAPSTDRVEGKPALMYGLVIESLERPETIPSYCANRYYVYSDVLSKFLELTKTASAQCGHPLQYVALKQAS